VKPIALAILKLGRPGALTAFTQAPRAVVDAGLIRLPNHAPSSPIHLDMGDLRWE
jgi:hypothetical protein